MRRSGGQCTVRGYRLDKATLGKLSNTISRGRWGFTPLLLAAHKGHTIVIERLLSRGADVNAQTNYGWTALELALGQTDKIIRQQAVRVLLERGARLTLDNEGRTAFHRAVEACDGATIVLLSKYGADIESKDLKGRTALLFAASLRDCDEVVRVLVACGADIKSRDLEGYTGGSSSCTGTVRPR